MTEIDNEDMNGRLQIADGVIAAIAGTAAMEADGVVSLSGNVKGEIPEKMVRKNFGRGIKVSFEDKAVVIDISLVVRFNNKLRAVATAVQEKVKAAVENMTGVKVLAVNVNIIGITARHARAAASR